MEEKETLDLNGGIRKKAYSKANGGSSGMVSLKLVSQVSCTYQCQLQTFERMIDGHVCKART